MGVRAKGVAAGCPDRATRAGGPASIAVFSGVWAGGAWDGILPHVLIVKQVSATGDATVISSWVVPRTGS